MNSSYVVWLEQMAQAAGVPPMQMALHDQGMLVHGVACHFICPSNAHHTVLVVLDAGAIDLTTDVDYLHLALANNLQNFLNGAPQYLWDANNGRLVIAQRFAYAELEPVVALGILQSLALQALAWQRREI